MAIGIKVPILSELNSRGFKAAQAEFKKLETNAQRFQFVMKKAFSPAGLTAMAGAATTVGYALYDMANAAAEDAREQAILATALKNTTGATDEQIAQTEKLITAMQMATGVSDSELRVGFGNLARGTEDLTESISLMTLAVDISVATGRDLSSVTQALGRAATGQIGAITRLGIPLDEATKASGDFERVVQKLSDTFGGAAAANAETMAGKMDILNQKFNESKEELGTKTIPVLTNIVNAFNSIDDAAGKVNDGINSFKDDMLGLADATVEMASQLPGLGFLWKENKDGLLQNEDAAQNATDAFNRLKHELIGVYDAMYYGFKALDWTVSVGLPNLNDHLESLGYSTKIVTDDTFNLGGSFQETATDAQRFAEALTNAQKSLAGVVTGYLNFSKAAEAPNGMAFTSNIVGQAKQIQDLAKNLGKLSAAGLSPMVIQGIMSLDLPTAAALASNMANSAFLGGMVKRLNRAYSSIQSTATSFGQTYGANFMTGGAISIGQITVVSNDPRKFVSGLRQYARNNGSVPIPVTGSL